MALIQAVYKDNRGKEHYPDLSALASLGEEAANRLILSYNRYSATFNSSAASRRLRGMLTSLGRFCESHSVNLKDAVSFHTMLYEFRRHWFSLEKKSRRLETRNSFWDGFRLFLKFCMEEGAVAEVVVPPGNPKFHRKRSVENRKYYFSDAAPEVAEHEFISAMVTFDLSRTDEEYLNELEQKLRDAENAFLTSARAEIAQIRADVEEGERLGSKANYLRLQEKIRLSKEAGHPFKDIKDSKKGSRLINLFSTAHPDFAANVISYIQHEYSGILPIKRWKYENTVDMRLRIGATKGLTPRGLSRRLSMLTTRDAIPFFVILLLKNPRFTVEGLLNAEVVDKHGRLTLVTSLGEDGKRWRMKIEKPRAGKEKSESLDDESMNILRLLIRLTQPHRDVLARQNHPNCNKLWLTVPKGPVQPIWMSYQTLLVHFGTHAKRLDDSSLPRSFRSNAQRSFLNVHEELEPYVPSAQMRMLRVLGGLLKWFETDGDAAAVARTLGNSTNVAMRNYIPKTLQLLMNKRMIRRHQNLLIAAATSGEDYMIEATDFDTQEELHDFLDQMLLKQGGVGDHIARVREGGNLGETSSNHQVKLGEDKQVRVSVSEEGLALLFLYREAIEAHNPAPEQKATPDKVTQTSMQFWSDLAQILHNYLPSDNTRRELARVYKQAMRKVESLRGTLRFPGLSSAGEGL